MRYENSQCEKRRSELCVCVCVCPLYQSHQSAKTLWESGFNFYFWMAEHFFIPFVIFLLSHLYRNCDNKFHSHKTPDTKQILVGRNSLIFFFCEHDWLMKSNGFQTEFFFIDIARLSLVIICYVFNKYSPMNISIYFFQSINCVLLSDSTKRRTWFAKNILIWFVN